MSLTSGSRFGSFEIVSPLGVGGMGEVYRAIDTKLKRHVALKVLPAPLAGDPDRLMRFQREAEVLASLNHPHIAQIHGVEEQDTPTPARALIMELVEGPTLADRIAEGPLPLEEALAIARQVAEALEAAHEQGIIHRDLKPANIKLRPDGTVKVLDFGLAKLTEAGASGASIGAGLTMSPTITSPAMTQAGIILGTAAYMSPEQARGKAVDKRADIWAFGVVLYEMLAGERPFKGEDLTETLASVVKDQSDLSKTPLPVRKLLAKCLEKDPKRRLRDIGDAWDLLDQANSQQGAAAPRAPAWRRMLPWAIAAGFALVAAITATLYVRQPVATSDGAVRFQLSAALQAIASSPVVSPDGRHIAYQTGSQILVRDLDATAPRVIATSDASVGSPFWSGDSRFVLFDAGGRLTRVDVAGGPPQTVCDLPGILAGGFGTHDDRLFFTTLPGGLRQVPIRGGEPTLVGSLRQPSLRGGSQLLPGGRFVYAGGDIRAETAPDSGIYVGALDGSGEPVRVVSGGVRSAAYVPARDGGSGYLVFTRGPTLLAQRFDGASNQLSGEPIVVADQVGFFSASESGALIYGEAGEGRRLVWVDRQGKQTGTVWAPGDFNELRLSPDGSKVAVVRARGTSTWVFDFAREAGVKSSSSPTSSVKPVWSPDGSRIVFSGNRAGRFDLYSAPANGAGRDEPVLKSNASKYPLSWSRDGLWLLYNSVDPSTKEDLWVLPMAGTEERPPEPFLVTSYRETDAAFSPDARFVAYVSDESGRSEVYVRSFPASTGGKWAVSNGGGYQPRWRADGKELLYFSGRGQLLSVDVGSGAGFEAGSPRILFSTSIFGGGSSINNWYWDIAPDGQRMLFNAGSSESGTSLVTVVLNWQAGLKPVVDRP